MALHYATQGSIGYIIVQHDENMEGVKVLRFQKLKSLSSLSPVAASQAMREWQSTA